MAVSEMYDLLYSTDSITEVRLDDYLNRITASFPHNLKNITIEKKLDEITIPVRKAIPIGIITAELITNSLKHAFTDKKKGAITLSLKKNKTGVVIKVKDDGKGLPEGFNISESNSLGIKLVHTLTDQIKGSFKIKGDKGTSCVLEFPTD